MTPSELLLAAADRLETLAQAATPGPWATEHQKAVVRVCKEGGGYRSTVARLTIDSNRATPDAAFIATMDPSVALAVAAWLRETSEAAALQERLNLSPSANEHALAAARAVLKEADDA